MPSWSWDDGGAAEARGPTAQECIAIINPTACTEECHGRWGQRGVRPGPARLLASAVVVAACRGSACSRRKLVLQPWSQAPSNSAYPLLLPGSQTDSGAHLVAERAKGLAGMRRPTDEDKGTLQAEWAVTLR